MHLINALMHLKVSTFKNGRKIYRHSVEFLEVLRFEVMRRFPCGRSQFDKRGRFERELSTISFYHGIGRP
jgi:hypothetical protein